MGHVFAVTNSLRPVAVPFAPGFELDVEALVAAQPALIYLCRPNNPTGTLYSSASFNELLSRFDGLVVVDEAYAEYAGDPVTPRAPALERVVSLRTMSKAWGLAGLRIGYAVGNRLLIDLIERVRGPFKLTVASEQVALAALKEDGDWMRTHVEETLVNRERFIQELRTIGYAPVPSSANFLLIPVAKAQAVADELLRHDVFVRPFTSLPGIGDALRITVGPDEAIQRVIEVLAAFK
jgi:histidinol-phosphate aminotransferase